MSKQFIRAENYDTVQFDEHWIILNWDNYTVTKINELGGLCWSLLKEKQSIPTLIEAIHKEYQGQNEGLEQDLEAFLLEIKEYGLIRDAG